MGRGEAMGGVAGLICALCAVTGAIAKPNVREVEHSQLIPNTEVVFQQVVVPDPEEAANALELDGSVRRMMRFGFSYEDMHSIPVSPLGLRYGLPVDEQAARDDRVFLNKSFAVGTLTFLQRDQNAFKQFGGQLFFREDAVPGVKYFPIKGSELHLGAGVLLSVDGYDQRSLLAMRPYLALAQVGIRF